MSNKKYNISIQGEGTAEEILGTLVRLFVKMNDERLENKEWNNTQSVAGTNEYCYSDDGVLRTEINEVNE